jgi:hypothetical protein
MNVRYQLVLAIAAVLVLVCARGAAAETSKAGDLDVEADTAAWRASGVGAGHLTPLEVSFLVEYERYQATQKAGLGLFGGGFGVAVAGIVLTVIDPFGALGLAGFITIGGGVVIMSSGMFVLGLSRAAWQRSLREEFNDVLTGRTVGYTWHF